VKAKNTLFFLLLVGATTLSAYGQDLCPTSSRNLVCELPITSTNLNPTGNPGQQNSEKGISSQINASFATQLTQLPIPSAAVGVVFLQEKGNQFGTPYDNLGPILTERPETVGKGYLFGGFSYQHFNFNRIDGLNLDKIAVFYTENQTSATGTPQTVYGSVDNNISFQLDQYVALLTYGLTRRTDLSVVVPFNTVSLDVAASNFRSYVYDSSTNQYSNESYPASTTVTTTGSSSGIGDVAANFKQMLYGFEGSKVAVSVGGSVRFPTGDKLNYLGSGAWGANVYGLFAYRWKVSPHLKLSNQWNGTSALVSEFNPSTQTYTNRTLPGGIQYAAGADWRMVRALTVSVDVLGSQFVNTPSLAAGTLTLAPAPTPIETSIPKSLTGVTNLNNTFTTSDLSAGLKWSPHPGLVFYGNVLLSINNVGIRSDPVPLFGISYSHKIGR
jgi:hypothetical protein